MPRHTALAVALLALLLGGGALLLPQLSRAAATATYPYERGISLVRRHAWERLKAAVEAFTSQTAVQADRHEAARLRIDTQLLESLQAENTRLRRLLGFAQRYPARAIPAPVLSEGGLLGIDRTLRIGRGSADGIAPGQPVIVPEGLVGRIAKTALHHAEVLLITDPDCRVAVETIPDTEDLPRCRGILFGGGPQARRNIPRIHFSPNPLILRYLDRKAEILPRTPVVTSGIGGHFPAGIPVGWVRESFTPEPELYREATIQPAAELAGLDLVFVLAESPTREPAR